MVEVNTIEQVGRQLPNAQQFAGNSLISINPYKKQGIWQFDDERIGVTGEVFVEDINKMIDDMVKKARIKKPEKGFRAIFSAKPFPGVHMVLNLITVPPKEQVWENGVKLGADYQMEGSELKGWLCPVLLCFFSKAPKHIYVKAESL